MTYFAAFFYVAAMLLANLLVSKFGPSISPILAFFLIGFDLSMRDWLHIKLHRWQMIAMIVIAGAMTYILNPTAGMIAIASAAAFTSAALVDWATFAKLRGSWMFRANGSNVAGAAVDSLIFPTIAFGALMPHIVAMQFLAKVVGGAVWAWVIARFLRNDQLEGTGA